MGNKRMKCLNHDSQDFKILRICNLENLANSENPGSEENQGSGNN